MTAVWRNALKGADHGRNNLSCNISITAPIVLSYRLSLPEFPRLHLPNLTRKFRTLFSPVTRALTPRSNVNSIVARSSRFHAFRSFKPRSQPVARN